MKGAKLRQITEKNQRIKRLKKEFIRRGGREAVGGDIKTSLILL